MSGTPDLTVSRLLRETSKTPPPFKLAAANLLQKNQQFPPAGSERGKVCRSLELPCDRIQRVGADLDGEWHAGGEIAALVDIA